MASTRCMNLPSDSDLGPPVSTEASDLWSACGISLTANSTLPGFLRMRGGHHCAPKPVLYNDQVGSWTGRSLPAFLLETAGTAGRGKSELRRAVCRITSGRADSSPFDGKCHRKHTALVSL